MVTLDQQELVLRRHDTEGCTAAGVGSLEDSGRVGGRKTTEDGWMALLELRWSVESNSGNGDRQRRPVFFLIHR